MFFSFSSVQTDGQTDEEGRGEMMDGGGCMQTESRYQERRSARSCRGAGGMEGWMDGGTEGWMEGLKD